MARRKPPATHGVCVVDKPSGVTSHDVVGMLRRRFGERQVGHAGTLDPDATGVLVVGVGVATRLLRFVEATTKRYSGEVVLGIETSTLDASGDVTARFEMPDVSAEFARRTVSEHLLGEVEQVPPMVSAIKVGGVRLHELARQGIEIERRPRVVTIHSFGVEPTGQPGVLAIEVVCSPGTYVRTLAADLGRFMGGGAHLRNLRRTAVGDFDASAAAAPDECELLPIETTVSGLTQVTIGDDLVALVANGRVLKRFDGQPPWALIDGDGALVAVYEPFGTTDAKPSVVLPAPGER